MTKPLSKSAFLLLFSIFFLCIIPQAHAQLIYTPSSDTFNHTCNVNDPLNMADYTNTYQIEGNNTMIAFSKTCVNGCSSMLADCRPDLNTQTLYAIIILGFFLAGIALSVWISNYYYGLDWPILIIILSMNAMTVAVDFFSTSYRAIFLVFLFIPLIFLLASILRLRIKEED